MKRTVVLSEGKSIVQVVLPHSWVVRINELAVERGLNRSALIREALEYSFGTDLEQHVLDRATASQPNEEVIAAS